MNIAVKYYKILKTAMEGVVIMKHRIIKITGCKTCKEVLLNVAANWDDDKSIEVIELEMIAWHKQNGTEYYQYEKVPYSDKLLLEGIVADFSIKSATAFALSFNF